MIQPKQPAPLTARRQRHYVGGRNEGCTVQPYGGLELFHVYTVSDKHVVHVPAGFGEEVRSDLLTQGVASTLSPNAQES